MSVGVGGRLVGVGPVGDGTASAVGDTAIIVPLAGVKVIILAGVLDSLKTGNYFVRDGNARRVSGMISCRGAMEVFILDQWYLLDNATANLKKSDKLAIVLSRRCLRTSCVRQPDHTYLLVISIIWGCL